ncbi:hypothetical protein CSH63_27420 [Micromonospora tulbaghiae]|uniref:Uncharacterized protein n=1 Tax=Micromonospora tulbaghiae TaxID=479978 RepID=A0A386WT14_9ACTN|nr:MULTISPECIES: hypothetical protein [Micromonospora]AYF31103.1 hypothetical protein CSH63_27420 [Micromonospora tulbaghiae]MCT2276318.1 hypothetical protein [Micromonospora chalcea]
MGALTRVARTAAATLSHTFAGPGEDPVTITGQVTVTGTDPDGDLVFTGTAAPGAGGGYEFAMPAQAQLGPIDVTWSGAVGSTALVERDVVEIVGGFLFTLAQARGSDKTLQDTAKYPTADLLRVRTEVEQECEWICDQAWVPRYRRVVLDGTGTADLVLPTGGDLWRAGTLMRGVRAVRAASVAARPGQAPVPLTGAQLAGLVVRADGTLRRADDAVWTAGDGNVVVEYEYGADAAPADLVRAALTRLRDRINFDKRGVPDRAVSFTIPEQGTYRLSLPDAYRTGLPEVDAAYGRYSRRVSDSSGPGGRAAAASRPLDYDPQFWSIFHGGRR